MRARSFHSHTTVARELGRILCILHEIQTGASPPLCPLRALMDFPLRELFLTENLNTENGYLLGQPPKVKSIMNVTVYNIYLESFCG